MPAAAATSCKTALEDQAAEYRSRLAQTIETWIVEEATAKLIAAQIACEELEKLAKTAKEREHARSVRGVLYQALYGVGGGLREADQLIGDMVMAFDPQTVDADEREEA